MCTHWSSAGLRRASLRLQGDAEQRCTVLIDPSAAPDMRGMLLSRFRQPNRSKDRRCTFAFSLALYTTHPLGRAAKGIPTKFIQHCIVVVVVVDHKSREDNLSWVDRSDDSTQGVPELATGICKACSQLGLRTRRRREITEKLYDAPTGRVRRPLHAMRFQNRQSRCNRIKAPDTATHTLQRGSAAAKVPNLPDR